MTVTIPTYTTIKKSRNQMIDITPRTVEILKNFCTINKSIVIKPGNQLSTLSINKNILAVADVEEAFDSEIAIYDLGMFINGLMLLDQPKINTDSKSYVTITDAAGRSKTRYFYADPDIITQAPEEEIKLPSMDVSFHLDAETLRQLNKAASIYALPDLCLFGDGEEMNLTVTDKKNETSNNFSVRVGTTTENFCYCFRVENLKLLAGAYDVSISSKNVAKFQGNGIKYYIALEPNA
tara:strand:- start:27 stop:737 length:711 start_codon:yes stop_codon:yes gene_type:complete